ncbi:NAD(P)/FAD-dependent oxidoreductase [Rubellicoccus peritrichatus]|uniref:Pyridine nucleotide-disulfide oxidoreductase domain-containing protein 2 n=1 Tax=Rubellicoccus peritrichatus TaxID=3080537 RepID=A0AAQ3LDF2_9BACT|nr:NAD(P)/FAD-dependent oxidoreductase [Puniceicoccus sp. CR14]WOO41533.1 NAD(P)/FAD-dependent oxidoreductase [Puniceicoccus sp. CR14]
MPKPDILFIGGGINALGAALMLSEAGWKVMVLDRNAKPGGAIRTMELTLPGFRHDIGAMNLNALTGSPFYKDYSEALARKGLEIITADHPNGVMTADGRFLGMSTNLEKNMAAIARFSSKDAEAWKQWRADFSACGPTLARIFGSEAISSNPEELIFSQANAASKEAASALRGILLDSLRDNLCSRFESDAIQSLVASWGLHVDYAPDIAGGCWMPFIETNVDELAGISLAQGGSGQVIRAMVELIEDKGGLVVTDQNVDKILVENGKATGVQLSGGETISSTQGVVASVTPQALVKLAAGNLPEDFVKQAEGFQYGPGTMVLHLALSGAIDWKVEAARRSFYVHLAPSLDYLGAVYEQSMVGLLPAEPFCIVGQPSVYDLDRAPEGKQTIWVMVRGVPAEIRGDASGTIEGHEWNDKVSDAFANRVIDTMERYAPGLREKILAKQIISPTGLQKLNPNLVGGDLNGGSQHLSQFYGNRPIAGFADHTTPIDALYLCGASTWPGGGATPGSGTMLARKLLG